MGCRLIQLRGPIHWLIHQMVRHAPEENTDQLRRNKQLCMGPSIVGWLWSKVPKKTLKSKVLKKIFQLETAMKEARDANSNIMEVDHGL